MPSIQVPDSFFKKEKANLYGEWRMAFWRELLSNSIDAGADKVHIRMKFIDGRIVVDVADNGCGMTRETIETIYMKLGASSKDGTDGVGGFGRARILTCFGQDFYSIRTRDFTVKGKGAQYEIHQAGKDLRGTVITVGVDNTRHNAFMLALYRVLEQSSLRVSLTMDLPRVDPDGCQLPLPGDDKASADPETGHLRYTGWSRKGKSFGALADGAGEWGALYVSNGDKALKGRAIIRVNGMSMYDEVIAAQSQVVIDLVPARAKNVMTIARDSIRHEFRGEMSKLFAKIAADQKSAFRDRPREPERSVFRTRTDEALRIGKQMPGKATAENDRLSMNSDLSAAASEAENAYSPSLEDIRRQNDTRRPDMSGGMAASPVLQEDQHSDLGPRLDVAFAIENASTAQRAAAPRFRPETWLQEGSTGRNAELLHAAWAAACRHALGALVEHHPGLSGETWAAGFVFDQKMGACHMQMGEVQHALLLNPVDAEGRQKYKLSDPQSMKMMATLAVHEVCHCVHDWHDEDYANLFTTIAGSIRDRDMEASIREELDLARSYIEERAMKVHPEQPAEPAENFQP